MIKFDEVSKKYQGSVDALSRVSFELATGEMAFLTGHSGAGKSTLMKLIILLERASQGQVFVNGVNLKRVSRRYIPMVRRGVGVVFQNHQLLFDRSVYDNVALPLTIAGYAPREVGRRVRAALSKVSLSDKEKQMPSALSGGEQQRVGIARAVVNKPPVLLADEPTGNLDSELSREILELFRQFNQVGVCVLIATHDLNLVRQGGCRQLVLNQGKLIGNGS
ncbi:MAG TPA: cell division ATP-binding protein FtsE [Gammaproteobacteria bacterium]|nr:cell division ATP-binding protein FtsE [Gammaproteobacteria bacterium]|tara:strand:- start:182 stop:844 length:663 start_codon:yes stop_codon:yes gene_type:complete